jgi:hypothetical protein
LLRPVRDGFVSPQESCAAPAKDHGRQTGDAATTPASRQVKAGAVADRQHPDLWLSCRQRRIHVRLRLAQSHAQEAKIYPPGQPKPLPGPGSRARGFDGAGAVVGPPSETANKTPIPPAMAGHGGWPAAAQRLRIDDDPFGAVGDYAGGFLVKSAIELGGGYDTNPRRRCAKGSPLYVVAPEFLAVSDWERHAVVADSGIVRRLRQHLSAAGRRHHLRRRRSISTGRISPAISTAASMSAMTPACWANAVARPPTTRQPEHPGGPADIRFIQRSAAPSASTRTSTACRPPAAPSTALSIPTQNSPTASTSNDDRNFNQFGGSAASATTCRRV